MSPDLARIFQALDTTWPAQTFLHEAPWTLRLTHGAGRRVSAASLEGAPTPEAIARAEARMLALGQERLFAIRPGQQDLDDMLAARGYQIVDPVEVRMAPVADFPPPMVMRSFPHWPPLAIAGQIWQDGGIGPARQQVMARVKTAKCAVLGRSPQGTDRVSGVAFVACDGPIAMLHGLEVVPALRRQGSAHHIMCAAAHWAQDQGASALALLVKADNTAAVRLYASLGMGVVGHYHYRKA